MDNKYNKDDNLIQNLTKLVYHNCASFIVLSIGFLIITFLTKENIFIALFTIYFAQLVCYVSHYLIHAYPNNILSQLHLIHHDVKESKKPHNIVLEVLIDFLILGAAILIPLNIIFENFTHIHILNNYIILYWALLCVSYHFFNYHFVDSISHKTHHETEKHYFHPEWFDIMFGTKVDGDEMDDFNSSVYNNIASTIFIVMTYQTPYDPIAYLKRVLPS